MRRMLLLLPCAAVLLLGGPPTLGDPPDGTPDISGTWVGKLKIETWDQHGNEGKEKLKAPAQLEIAQTGADVTMTLYADAGGETREFLFTGQVGRGHVWAVREEPGEVMLLVGHARKGKLKGRLLSAEDFSVSEVEFKFKLETGEAQTPVPGTPSGSADGFPLLPLNWSGKHKWEAWAQYGPEDGAGKTKPDDRDKNPIEVNIAQAGGMVDVVYTVFDEGSREDIPLRGEYGNGHLWAIGTHPRGGGPVFVVLHRKKNKLKGFGIAVFDDAIFWTKVKVKADT